MNVNVLNGLPGEQTSITGVETGKKKDTMHNLNVVNPLLIAGRNAFRVLVSLNIWGLATALNWAWARSKVDSSGVAVMGSEKQKWYYGWYNLGGDFNKLQKSVNSGRNKKAKLLKLAPKDIRKFYENAVGKKIAGVPGLVNQGVSIEPATAAALAAVPPILLALNSLLKSAFAAAGKDVGSVGVDDPGIFDADGNGNFQDHGVPGGGDGSTQFGMNFKPLLLAGAAAAAFFFLTKKK